MAHPTHQLHYASFVDHNVELPLVLCTRCGAHGTSKVAKLAAPCQAAAASDARSRNAPFRKQAAAVARRMHPSRRGIELRDLRVVPPGLRAIGWSSRLAAEALARPPATAAAPLPAAGPATAPGEPPPGSAAHDGPAAALPDLAEGTGQPLEELLALEALAAQAATAPEDEGPTPDDELGFGGFDD